MKSKLLTMMAESGHPPRSRWAMAVLYGAGCLTGAGACTQNLDYLKAGRDAGVDTGATSTDAIVPSAGSAGASSEGGSGGHDGGILSGGAGGDRAGNQSNLLANPGFESGVSPWISWGAALTTSSVYAHSGSFSGLVTGRTHTYSGAVQDITSVVIAGQRYVGSAWAMIDSNADAGLDQPVDFTAKIGCESDGGVSNTFEQIGATTAHSSNWSEIQGTFTIPQDCNIASVSVYLEGPVEQVDLYVDDVSVSL